MSIFRLAQSPALKHRLSQGVQPIHLNVMSLNRSVNTVTGNPGHTTVTAILIVPRKRHKLPGVADLASGITGRHKCSKVLDLPEDLRPMTFIPIGYPASDSIPEKKRKPLDEIVKFL